MDSMDPLFAGGTIRVQSIVTWAGWCRNWFEVVPDQRSVIETDNMKTDDCVTCKDRTVFFIGSAFRIQLIFNARLKLMLRHHCY